MPRKGMERFDLLMRQVLTGSAELFLPVSPIGELLKDIIGDKEPSVRISWPQVFVLNNEGKSEFNPDGLSVTLNDFEDLINFEDMDFGTILAALEDLADFLGTLEGLEFLKNEIPLIGVSPSELIGFVGDFRQFIIDLRTQPTSTIGQIEKQIEGVLKLGDEALDLTLLPTGDVLKVDLNYKPSFDARLQPRYQSG